MATIHKDGFSVNEEVLVGAAEVRVTIKEFFGEDFAVVYVRPSRDNISHLFVAHIADFKKIDA